MHALVCCLAALFLACLSTGEPNCAQVSLIHAEPRILENFPDYSSLAIFKAFKSAIPTERRLATSMATSATHALSSWSQRRSAPGSASAGGSSFLSFLGIAQALGVAFLPITWEAERVNCGIGATAKIYQALLTADTSFAFKTFRSRALEEKRSQEDTLQTLIDEITMLSQPFMRQHANIAQLQGICFEISPDDDKPWPVLVFEKSYEGGLWNFSQRTCLTVDERLGTCADVTRAIITMHANSKSTSHFHGKAL